VNSDDYSGMGRFSRSSDLELDQLLSEAGDVSPENRHLTDALRLTRRSVAPLDPAARRRHLAVMFEAASELRSAPLEVVPAPASPTWRRGVRRSWATTLKLAAATMAASLSLVGLAAAQVDLPGTAVESAVDAVLNVQLPDVAASVRSLPTATEGTGSDEGGSGLEFPGSDAASGADPGSKGEEHSRDGRATASEASDGRSDLGSENAGTHNDAGQAQAEEASDNDGVNNGSDNGAVGADNAGTNDDQGRATAEEKSADGKEQGETKSEEGKSHKPTDDDSTDGDT
jgi:hypothetical protein